MGNPSWWRNAVGYEIYLRSFADSDGDGVGDLPGIRRRLPYLAQLGIDIVWVTPCFPSPGADHGYDISDYLSVAPVFGGTEALDALVTDAHDHGLKVILDLVPNHTSDQHPWFKTALADPDSTERDYYIWRPPRPDGGPPTNWRSHFGGPAWTLDEASGQYYLHRFLPEQPDLNWRNPAVTDEFHRILRFWFERGVDGFRIDVAHGMLVDEAFRDNPDPDVDLGSLSDPRAVFAAIEHEYDLDLPGVPDLYRSWHDLAADHDAVLLGEVYLPDPDRVARYVADGCLHAAFCFPALKTGWDARAVRSTLQTAVAAGNGRFAWPLSSHDDPRAATRFGGAAAGAERQLAYLTLLASLPGLPFLYQGDELGLENGDLPATDLADPVSVRHGGGPGRDGSRTPMPWAPGPGFGFTTGTPWIGFGANRTDEDTAEVQERDDDSVLARTRRLLHTRRELTGMLATDEVQWLDVDPEVVALRRGDVTVAVNFAPATRTVALDTDAEVVFASHAGAAVDGHTLTLPPDTAVYLRGATP